MCIVYYGDIFWETPQTNSQSELQTHSFTLLLTLRSQFPMSLFVNRYHSFWFRREHSRCLRVLQNFGVCLWCPPYPSLAKRERWLILLLCQLQGPGLQLDWNHICAAQLRKPENENMKHILFSFINSFSIITYKLSRNNMLNRYLIDFLLGSPCLCLQGGKGCL